jgi:hypothetical protein
MLEAKMLSYKKFALVLDLPVMSTEKAAKYGDITEHRWTTIEYMIRYRIPVSVVSNNYINPCDDKKSIKQFFDSKFKGRYRIVSENKSVRLPDGRIMNVYLPTNIKVFKSLQELRDISIESLLEED